MVVKKIAVIGAGIMGRGIAQVAAAAGYEVVLMSRQETTLNKALAIIKKNLQKQIERGKLTAEPSISALRAIISKAPVRRASPVSMALASPNTR